MFYYLMIFLLILSLPNAILAIKCYECIPQLHLNSSDGINITKFDCKEKETIGDMCFGSLFINFHDTNGSGIFTSLPDQVLTFSNGPKMTIVSTIIWFSKSLATQSIQSMNIDSEVLIEDINTLYSTSKFDIVEMTIDAFLSSSGKTLNIPEVRTKLMNDLVTSVPFVANLTCANNKGESVSCPNGFCQSSESSSAIVDRKCVRQGKFVNPLGIIIGSTSIEESVPEETIVYSCNKPMCNNAEISQKVRNSLFEYRLISTNTSTTPPVTPVTNATTTSTTPLTPVTDRTSTSTREPTTNHSHPLMEHFQWTFLLFLSNLFIIISM